MQKLEVLVFGPPILYPPTTISSLILRTISTVTRTNQDSKEIPY